MALPVQYREGASNFVFNVDYFDWAAGAGYKAYYAVGGQDDTGDIFYLTADATIVSDYVNIATANASEDIDFDITFNNPVTIAAADAYITYHVEVQNGRTLICDFNIYHYDGSTETLIGSASGDTIPDPAGTQYYNKTNKCLMTKTKFNRGDILRFNAVTTVGGAGGGANLYYDPSGHITQTDPAGGSWTSQLKVNLPFEVKQ